MKHRVVLAALALTGCAAAAAQQRVGDTEFEQAFGHVIMSIDGARACHRFRLYVAETPGQRSRGLMYVRDMAHDDGMIFIYDRPARISMWMRNTVIPLDMLFVDADGQILNIERSTTPYSRRSIPSDGPARYVVEVNAGVTADLGMRAGTRLFRPDLAPL
ncbi:MAG: DUF192 domain-containing protein [Pseudomonadota bacterium]